MRELKSDKQATRGGVNVPDGVPEWITPELVRATMETWQPFYCAPLTPDDAVVILTNVGRLFRVLSEA